jgi:DNA repair exonuclease SbcCD nuclease subunit
MKLVIFSDIQFENWQEFHTILPSGLNSRFQDQLNVLDEVFDYAEDLAKKDEVVVVHNGDLFQSLTEKIDKALFLKVYEKFSSRNVVTILLVGNHDFLDRTETTHIIEPFKKIPNVMVVDKPAIQTVEGVGLFFIPYTRKNFLESVNNFVLSDCPYNPKYLFTHQGVNGATVGPRDMPMKEDYNPKDFRLDWFDMVFNGHYHKPQSWIDKSPGIGKKLGSFQIIGSPLQKDFGERNDGKGFWVLDTKKAPRNPVFIETHGPKFYKMEITKDYNLKGFPCRSNDFLWVVSEGVSEDKVKEMLGVDKNFNVNNTRIEVVARKVYQARTSISVGDPTEEKLKKFIDYFETDLDKEVLLQKAVEKYKEAIS